jgi:NAD(P)-dependent dehydrogenase (short-subunit alcohol dehydrogenase family)
MEVTISHNRLFENPLRSARVRGQEENVVSRISLEDQVAIVTGSGAGLGRAYAHELASRGAAVVVNDFAPERADEVVAEIEAQGGRAVASYDSVSEADSAAAIVATAVDTFGTLDIIVNNAGTMRNAMFEDQTAEGLQQMLAVHTGGCFNVTHAAWRLMQEKRYGRVLMIGSAGGTWAMQALSNYAAAKGGVYGLARALAFEGRDHGIAVNVLLPGASTTIAGGPIPDYERHFRKELREAISPRRTPESVAPMVAYLVSRECDVTGETFSAVAGRYARVLVGVTDGWFVQDQQSVTADQIAEHFAEICDPTNYTLPTSLYDEYESIGRRLGIAPAP